MKSAPLLAPFVALLILSGCASHKAEPPTQFDFGPAVAAQPTAGALGTIAVADITGTGVLDSDRIFYRLSYADAQQARTYANSRWAAPPPQLITQRIKTRLAQAGARVLSEADASNTTPILRIDVDDFVQDFGGVADSEGRVAMRASVFRGHALVDQRTFSRTTRASGADAAGGARALATSLDGVTADIAAWLATLRLDAR